MSKAWKKSVTFILFVLGPTQLCLAGGPQWVEVKSPHFTVLTDDGEKTGRNVALRFEQMRAAFSVLYPKVKGTVNVPLQIIAFRKTKEMREVGPMFQGKPVELAGYYQRGPGMAYIAIDLSTEETWQTVFHEYGHQLLDAAGMHSPVWFDEGFAEYFSTIEPQGKKFIVGKIPQSAQYTLVNESWIPLEQVLSVEHSSRTYNVGGERGPFYAESWLAMLWLWFKPELKQKTITYLTMRDQNVPVAKAVQDAYGKDIKQMDKDFKTFFRIGSAAVWSYEFPPGLESQDYKSRPVDELDAKAMTTEMQMMSRKFAPETLAAQEELLKQRPLQPVALRSLGYAYLMQGEHAKASQYFDRATTADTNDGQAWYYSAMLMQSENPYSDDEKRHDMQRRLEKCIALRPDLADAHALLGVTYMNSRDTDHALMEFKRALELDAGNSNARMNMGMALMNAQRYDEASQLFTSMAQSGDANAAAQAQRMLGILGTMKNAGNSVRPVIEVEDDPASAPTRNRSAEPDHTAPTVVYLEDKKFFKGELRKVVCPDQARMVLTVIIDGKDFMFQVPDIHDRTLATTGGQHLTCSLQGVSVSGTYSTDKDGNKKVVMIYIEPH